MGLDIRIPIGLMFALIGALLAVYGVFSDKEIYERSLGININLWWGIVMLAFGAAMFWLGRRGSSALRSALQDAEGREIERREHREGLEKEAPRRRDH